MSDLTPEGRADAPAEREPGALGPEALDFWLGDWELAWAGGGHGTNTIVRGVGGRVIVETFHGDDADGTSLDGLSVSVFEGDAGPWRQTWVDSNGTYLDLVGVEVDGRISFGRTFVEGGQTVLQRMVWLDVTADALRWEWQRSDDGGTTWSTRWAIDYRRRS